MNESFPNSALDQSQTNPEDLSAESSTVLEYLHTGADEWFCFWLMKVGAVNLEEHCQKSLIGERVPLHSFPYGTPVKRLRVTELPLAGGPEIFYLCGVRTNFDWGKNFHLAFQRRAGASINVSEHGVTARVRNAERIEIKTYADNDHPRFALKSHRTCRNWQFAYMTVREGRLAEKAGVQRQGLFTFLP